MKLYSYKEPYVRTERVDDTDGTLTTEFRSAHPLAPVYVYTDDEGGVYCLTECEGFETRGRAKQKTLANIEKAYGDLAELFNMGSNLETLFLLHTQNRSSEKFGQYMFDRFGVEYEDSRNATDHNAFESLRKWEQIEEACNA